jgi:RNA polymerase sigma-70 factor (ECF subfamily)
MSPSASPAEATAEPSWRQFEQQLRSYVGRRVPNGAADDLVGDILLRLVRSRDKLAAANNPTAWVYRVAANAITDYRRSHARETSALEAFAQDDTAQEPESETADLARCLLPLMRNLPDPYAEALLLTEIGGLTQADAASRLGLSVSGMKSRVQRARGKLKTALLRCCDVAFNSRGDVLDYRRKSVSGIKSGTDASRCAPADCSSDCVP